MKLPNRFEKWVLSGLAALACAGAIASDSPTPPGEVESTSQTSQQVSAFHPQESFAALSAEEKQNFSDRIEDLKSLARDRMTEAKELEDELTQPGDCGGIKTKQGCLREQAKALANAGKDASVTQELLDRPTRLRQSAAQLREIIEAGDQLHSKGTLADSLKNEGSGVYATYRDSFKYMIGKEPLIAITIGLAGYAATQPFSGKTSAYFNDPEHKWTGAKSQIGNFLGQGYTIIAPVWLAAKYTSNERLTQVADDWVAGGIVDGLITTGLKYTIREKRPDGSDNLGFPSGHATTAFMMAKIIQDEMGAKWGVPAFVLASYVGMSRIGSAKHTPGQVAVGAGLGYAIGAAVSQASAERRSKESKGKMNGHFQVGDTKVEYQTVPALTHTGAGIAVEGSF